LGLEQGTVIGVKRDSATKKKKKKTMGSSDNINRGVDRKIYDNDAMDKG